jgi:hypothetical protein
MAGKESYRKVWMDFNRKHGKNMTLLPNLLRSSRRLQVLEANQEVAVHLYQVQPILCCVHLQGVPRSEHEGWLQKAVPADRVSRTFWKTTNGIHAKCNCCSILVKMTQIDEWNFANG